MQTAFEAVERHRGLILDAFDYIWANPETGYKEVKTSRYMEERFEALGYELQRAQDITGFCAELDTGRAGPTLLVLGELDSIICPSHKDADPSTGAVHSCGHAAQCAALLGVAAALREPGVTDGLCGRIRLCAVPAEELLEIEYRLALREQGKIRHMGGKAEFLARGMFDGVDLAMMVHTSSAFAVRGGSVGCIAKKITYKGVSAHAGGSPWRGKNALYAANCGLNAVNAIRETFQEADLIRVHPIITAGGDMVNAIPERVTLESYVRGRTFEAICAANERVNAALIGAALSIGVNIEIRDIPGYAPLENDASMIQIAQKAFAAVCPDQPFSASSAISTGSTDMGDLSRIMPVVHPYAGGARGTSHGNDYEIVDPEAACVTCAKWQLEMIRMLLCDGAAEAKRIVAEYRPQFDSAKAYLDFMETLRDEGDRIVVREDGTATVRLKK